MTAHSPTLLLCSTLIMALSAGLMSLFAATQRIYRGYGCWTAAQWLAALGLGLHAWRDSTPDVLPLANLLLLQWPVMLLAGFRRFYPRDARGLGPGADWLLMGTLYLLWLANWGIGADVRWQMASFSLGMLLLHLYAALSLMHLSGFPGNVALKTLQLGLLTCSVGHGWQVVAGARSSPDIGWLLASTAVIGILCSLAMLYVGLVLTCDRTHQELALSQHRLRALANIDPLTEVPNRRHFHELAHLALAAETPYPAALLMIDIDHFKRINDLLGHKAGDQALCDVANSMRHSLRLGDVAGRLGGDEFVALLPATAVHDAIVVADRIVRPLSASTRPPLSLSFGVVQMHEGESLDDALHRADQALYEAKRQGRNCAVVATGNDDQPVFTESMPLGLMTL
jgi:diguanylate cyclase (GGDEF)-like protein